MLQIYYGLANKAALESHDFSLIRRVTKQGCLRNLSYFFRNKISNKNSPKFIFNTKRKVVFILISFINIKLCNVLES